MMKTINTFEWPDALIASLLILHFITIFSY